MKKTKVQHQISSHKHLLFAGIWSIFFILWISLFASNFTILNATDQYINQHTNNIPSKIPQFIQEDIQQQQIQQLIQKHKYQEALKQIQNKKPQDYFNRGVILLEQATNYSTSTQIDKLQRAKYLSKKAIENFKIAQKLQINSQLSPYIKNNNILAQQIHNINTFKFCFAWNESIIDQIRIFKQETQSILNTLQTEEQLIQENKKILNAISTNCAPTLQKSNHKNQNNIQQLQNSLENYQYQYTQKYLHILQDPKLCTHEQLDQIIDTLNPTKNTLHTYKQNHTQIISALNNKDTSTLKLICKNNKNDSQIQNNISHTMQDFLDKLQQSSTTKESSIATPTSTNPQYQNINQLSPAIKKQINDRNIQRIHQIQNITKHNYNPLQQLQNLFKAFYGNTNDYQQYLHYNKQN